MLIKYNPQIIKITTIARVKANLPVEAVLPATAKPKNESIVSSPAIALENPRLRSKEATITANIADSIIMSIIFPIPIIRNRTHILLNLRIVLAY